MWIMHAIAYSPAGGMSELFWVKGLLKDSIHSVGVK